MMFTTSILTVQSIRILLVLIIHILGFVDDNNLSNTDEKYETIRDILKKAQDDAQFWNNLITSSGASLELANRCT